MHVDRGHHGINRFALEGAPDDSAIRNCKLNEAVSRQDPAVRDLAYVHDGDDEIGAGASALDVLEKLRLDQVLDFGAKVRRVQRHTPLEVVEEKHGERAFRNEC